MTAFSKPSQPCLGFLTVLENAEHGFLGGYLLLNAAGRPLEFHCTAPIRASRTQEILYGPTLRPFLFGEQIGQTLLTKSKLSPLVVFTDSEPTLAVREFTDIPVVCVLGATPVTLTRSASEGTALGPATLTRRVSEGIGCCFQFQLATNQVAVANGYSNDEQLIRATWPPQADHLDLLEPFDRIREALDEAQRSARQAA
ncbi:MAG TPA: hypothetical protein VGI40_26375 [Pirellulaceae bacterium]|jgi:hypothetical protein